LGTRNLTCVFFEGEYKVAQYCQWDGYPGGQGSNILSFLRKVDLREFKEYLRNLVWIDENELQRRLASCGADGSGWVNMEIARKFQKKWPHLDRDAGADVLEMIVNTCGNIELLNSLDFAGDSLFCEWAYVIDFDKNTFEVYSGFVEEPLDATERFSGMECERDHRSKQYYPVKLIKEYSLDNLPSQKEFISYFNKKNAEEEIEEFKVSLNKKTNRELIQMILEYEFPEYFDDEEVVEGAETA